MPHGHLLELVEKADYDTFETRCIEFLESGKVDLPQLLLPFQRMQKAGQGARVATLATMVLEAAGDRADPVGALRIAKLALESDPNNADLRKCVEALYRRIYGALDGYEAVLANAGLLTGRPARNALRIMDACLTLNPGDAMISRTENRVVEVTEVDRPAGLFSVKVGGRVSTLPATELVREYEPIDHNDFRALRACNPKKLAERLQTHPAAIVIDILKLHPDGMDAETLKSELVPDLIAPTEWAKWWTSARTHLKRNPNVILEGRSPVYLKFTAQEQTLEDETWAAIQNESDSLKWMTIVEGYVREKGRWQEPPDAGLLTRIGEHIARDAQAAVARRPAAALASALVLNRLAELNVPAPDAARTLAQDLLRAAPDPVKLIAVLPHETLWEQAVALLAQARPNDWKVIGVQLFAIAPAGILDTLALAAAEAGHADDVQNQIDSALENPIRSPELLYWLWKGPKVASPYVLPSPDVLLSRILDTLSDIGRTLTTGSSEAKVFRARMKAALALRDYAKVRECLQRIDVARAIPMRRQLERLEGLGDNARDKLTNLLRDVHPSLWVVKQTRLKPWEDEQVIWCTQAGLRRKTEERDELVNVQMRDNARRIGEAAALGDLSENSEYKFALEERDFLRARLAQINSELSLARPMSEHDVPTDHIGVGSRITVRPIAGGGERTLTFLGPFEADLDRGIYNYRAPIAQKVMGAVVGDRIKLVLDGVECDCEVLKIEAGLLPESAGAAR